MFLGELLKPVGAKFLLHCNFKVSKLNISLPAFYKQFLVAWSELNAREPSSIKSNGTTSFSVLIRNLFTEEILRIKAFVKSGTYFLLIMYDLTLNKVFSF